MSDHVNIPVPGPHIVVNGTPEKERQRQEAARHNAGMAETLRQSGAWEWFVAQCEAKAAMYEHRLVNADRELTSRMEDRDRGRIEAYRSMPRVIDHAQATYQKLLKEANRKKGTPA